MSPETPAYGLWLLVAINAAVFIQTCLLVRCALVSSPATG